MQYDKKFLQTIAKQNGYNANTLEKVIRLVDVLHYLNEDVFLRQHLALKGGTALNLTVFDLPRLSVDIDLDFATNLSKNDMLGCREDIKRKIEDYMTANGYWSNPKSKSPHALDSFVFSYRNAAGNQDNLKVEINYMLRSHLFNCEQSFAKVDCLHLMQPVQTISTLDLLASKTAALINRSTPRDLYDFKNILDHGLISPDNQDVYRKSVAFYLAISSQKISLPISFFDIENINYYKIKTELLPVIKNTDFFNLQSTKDVVVQSLANFLSFEKPELEFLQNFSHGQYTPELLFQDPSILQRIKEHPMALWKTQKSSLAEQISGAQFRTTHPTGRDGKSGPDGPGGR